jgi:hypothetical protein
MDWPETLKEYNALGKEGIHINAVYKIDELFV